MSPLALRVAVATAFLLALVAVPAAADTNANCSYSGFLGHWRLNVTRAPNQDCTVTASTTTTTGLTFSEPNLVVDDAGNKGNFTIIYNQGVEAWVNGWIYFWFSAYDAAGNSYCDRSQSGWLRSQLPGPGDSFCISAQADSAESHNSDFWALYEAASGKTQKVKAATAAKPSPMLKVKSRKAKAKKVLLEETSFKAATKPSHKTAAKPTDTKMFKNDHAFLAAVNAAQSHFTVKEYPEFEEFTVKEMQRMSGSASKADLLASLPKSAIRLTPANGSAVPDNFDWRDINGVSYVSPVRAQGGCGSCYAFASAGMMEARIRVASKNAAQPIISTQEIVSCSQYAQGCEGGFPYLIAGKYGNNYGLAEESCYPYTGLDSTCKPNPLPECQPKRWFTKEYYYIGGYYGMSTASVMQQEIMANGPIAVSFQVYSDFRNYASGVYTHQFTKHLNSDLNDFNPFHLTNHVVVIVGWGVTSDAAETPYWIVKNSWGPSWGENGFFRILRNTDGLPDGGECAIESLTVSAIPILH